MFDFIGDIHGHSSALESLLTKLGYKKEEGIYRHSSRRAFFLGDFIDRGPDSKGVVQLVRRMVEAGQAKAIMGNHEWNAIQYHTKGQDGHYLRTRSNKNRNQHAATLESYESQDYISQELASDLEWFRSLPLFYEGDGFRAVHATWNPDTLSYLKQNYPDGIVDHRFIARAVVKSSPEYASADILLKGQESDLPDELHFQDKDGNLRSRARIKWWMRPEKDSISRFRPQDLLFIPEDRHISGTPALELREFPGYARQEPPVFFGHYWKRFPPELEAHNVCCLDYSVARGGHLMAYRWNGEQKLDKSNFLFVASK
ncbi:MAG TPA: phosphoesterase [Leptospiraceae bacterium]|nr:phosphoesterase [Spirochaetaceae bacterium]HBS06442.1 phosphoesterase [Leptospiraceae bacterium]|tara:strand:- start:34 stop:975 length:942 start_codon:yes stop_codon:yes gene_type:complete